MSKQNTTRTGGKVGRPATGRTTRTIRVSVPIWLADQSRQAAFESGETYSGLISRALRGLLHQPPSKP